MDKDKLKANALTFWERIAKLLDVKSIVTITGWIALIVFVAHGIVKGDDLVQMMQMIIVFFFGKATSSGKAE